MIRLEEILKQRWGYDSFRALQREAVETALSGRDSLVVLPTGGGKSLCYQLPAATGQGLVLVVSPLIALMDDQVAAAREAGLVADALHSNLEANHRNESYRRLLKGETELLYVSPERLLVGDLVETLASRVVLAAVDEAHCVSHWGHEFRPEYRQLAKVLERFPGAARMALTATATPAVQDDISAQLLLRDPARFIGHPDRPNLVYRAFGRRDQSAQVLDVVRRHGGEGGIVYAQTRSDVERLAAGLKKEGISSAPYHAGLPADQRRRAQDDFVNERLDVIVATIAFGMGIDRSNVRYVVHANAPRSVEHYQQESGRAGRDGLKAECVLLFAASDLVRHRGLALMNGPLAPERERAMERQLREIGRFAVAPLCRHRILAEHFGANYPLDGTQTACGACDVCLGETQCLPDDEAALTAKKILMAADRASGRFGTGYVAGLLLGIADERVKRNGHDKLDIFGALKEKSQMTLRSWIDQLIVQGFLKVVEEREYPLLSITQEGKVFCRDGGAARLSVPVSPPARAKKKPSALAQAAGAGLPPDQELFERLRRLRRLIAEKSGVPPYLVFHDAALVEMAALKPQTIEALRRVKGVGDHKLRRYGAAFVSVIGGAAPEALAGVKNGHA
ncbi:MAG: RecQ family ATP-dependent DNA helicase [Elusimicrobia bacterium]|nr:RecQ family ATP-dependent DNA helicase [Elusimicrobiota bacterium]